MNRSVVQYMTVTEVEWKRMLKNSTGLKSKLKNFLHGSGILKDKKKEVLEKRYDFLERKKNLDALRRKYPSKKGSKPSGIGVIPGDHSTYKYREIDT
jgi:hypothetical protein